MSHTTLFLSPKIGQQMLLSEARRGNSCVIQGYVGLLVSQEQGDRSPSFF